MLSGDNGIFTKAADSKKMTEIADAKEQAQIDILSWLSERISKGENSDLSDSIVKGILTGKSYVKTVNDSSFITASGGHEILYSDLYKKTTPTGPKAGESGYVGGYYDDPYIPVGFEHTGNDDWNSGYTIIGKTGTENAGDEFVWVPCVLDQARVKEGDTVQTFSTIYTGKYVFNGPLDSVEQEESREAIKNSVENYGGFYIAKYEAGIVGQKDNYTLYVEGGNSESSLTSLSTRPLSQAGKSVWNCISFSEAQTASEGMISTSIDCKSALISPECWDTTLQWIKNTSDSTYDENSENKGVYNQAYGYLVAVTTGHYSVNNIFDMAGNVHEITSEYFLYGNPANEIFVTRGGHYNQTGSSAPAATRNLQSGARDPVTGFRVVLYKEASNS